jgi:MAP/microtubule affinity-regulating kinase
VPPFQGNYYEELKQKILAGKYSIKFKLSPELWDMVAKLLPVKPGQRPMVHDIVSI